jgi:hypothetical protein
MLAEVHRERLHAAADAAIPQHQHPLPAAVEKERLDTVRDRHFTSERRAAEHRHHRADDDQQLLRLLDDGFVLVSIRRARRLPGDGEGQLQIDAVRVGGKRVDNPLRQITNLQISAVLFTIERFEENREPLRRGGACG